MTAQELSTWLRSRHAVPEPSVDRVIAGDPQREVRAIAVMWLPSWPALRAAATGGANVVVAHEPTFYTHHDLDGFAEAFAGIPPATRAAMEATRDAKRSWLEQAGLTVIRCHDVLDAMRGGVVDSLAAALGFSPPDYATEAPHFRVVRLAAATRAGDVAQRLATRFAELGQPGVAFYGDPERPVRSIGLGTGYGNDPLQHFALGADLALAIDDRIKTWCEPAWAGDSGYPIVVVNHGTAEEWGVRRLATLIARAHPEIPLRLVAQGCGFRWIAPAGPAER
jgi:putative NIF3 family GTP cyclohydrolase 1 type 2